MDTIEGMRTFVAVASQGSFTGGAKRRAISTKLASKYIRQLEQRMGVQLFNRTTRSVSLTETGTAYLARCVPLLEQLDELESLVQERQAELAGPIRITAPTGFGTTHLVKALLPFQAAHPNIAIDLHLADHYVPMIDEGIDLAIRFGVLQDSSLVARKLMDMRIVFCAAPGYLAENGTPGTPAELASHRCLLRSSRKDPYSWRFTVDGKIETIRVQGQFISNSPLAVARMAAGGLGIGTIPLYTAEPFLENGSLQLLFEEQEADVIGLYAVYPPSRHLTSRIRALIDHLVGTFSGAQQRTQTAPSSFGNASDSPRWPVRR